MAGEPLPESWAAEGRAIRRALAADFAKLGDDTRVVVTLDARFEPENGPWATVAVESGGYPERLLDLARRADYTVLVAPETTGLLERLTLAIEAAGGRVLGSTAEAVALTADKAALARRFEETGVPTPRSRVVDPREGLPADFREYPAVLKPIDGAGAVDTYRIAGPSGLSDAARAVDGPVAALGAGRRDERGVPRIVPGGGPADRDGKAADRDPRRSVRLRGGGDSRGLPGRLAGAAPRIGVGRRPARVRRGRFHLGCGSRRGERAGDQPAPPRRASVFAGSCPRACSPEAGWRPSLTRKAGTTRSTGSPARSPTLPRSSSVLRGRYNI